MNTRKNQSIPTPPLYYYKGFTLAETLITLVIVGIVAALTVPTLIAKYTEQQTVTAVKKFYSEISQAYNSAIAKNGPPETWYWKWNGNGAESLMNMLSPHLRIMNKCGIAGSIDKCFGDSIYKTLNQNVDWFLKNPGSYSSYSSARLDNGFVFWTYSRDNCNSNVGNTEKLRHVCGAIGVDINGYKKPNSLGRDVFYFWVTKYGIIPIGTRYDNEHPFQTYCNKSLTGGTNGYACAAWVIERGNMVYLHRDVNW